MRPGRGVIFCVGTDKSLPQRPGILALVGELNRVNPNVVSQRAPAKLGFLSIAVLFVANASVGASTLDSERSERFGMTAVDILVKLLPELPISGF